MQVRNKSEDAKCCSTVPLKLSKQASRKGVNVSVVSSVADGEGDGKAQGGGRCGEEMNEDVGSDPVTECKDCVAALLDKCKDCLKFSGANLYMTFHPQFALFCLF